MIDGTSSALDQQRARWEWCKEKKNPSSRPKLEGWLEMEDPLCSHIFCRDDPFPCFYLKSNTRPAAGLFLVLSVSGMTKRRFCIPTPKTVPPMNGLCPKQPKCVSADERDDSQGWGMPPTKNESGGGNGIIKNRKRFPPVAVPCFVKLNEIELANE
jgi:hypothetical protein